MVSPASTRQHSFHMRIESCRFGRCCQEKGYTSSLHPRVRSCTCTYAHRNLQIQSRRCVLQRRLQRCYSCKCRYSDHFDAAAAAAAGGGGGGGGAAAGGGGGGAGGDNEKSTRR